MGCGGKTAPSSINLGFTLYQAQQVLSNPEIPEILPFFAFIKKYIIYFLVSKLNRVTFQFWQWFNIRGYTQ